MGATGTSSEDVARLLSVLRAASLRAQAQLGATASTTTVDQRLESSRSATSDELDAFERATVVQAAVCSKPTPDGLTDAHFSQGHLGSPVREICTPGSAWGDEIKWPCLLGERCSRKRCASSGSARATVVKTRLYQPVRSLGERVAPEVGARRGGCRPLRGRRHLRISASSGRRSFLGELTRAAGKVRAGITPR